MIDNNFAETKETHPNSVPTLSGNRLSRRAGVLLIKAYDKNHLNCITISDAMYILDTGYNIALATLQELCAKRLLTKAKNGGIYLGFLDPKEAENLRFELKKPLNPKENN